MISFLRNVYHYIVTCGMKGHKISDHYVTALFADDTCKESHVPCCKCNMALIIYKLDNDTYSIIEDV